MSELTIRPITVDDLPALAACVADVFGYDPATDPLVVDRMRALLPVERTFAAFDAGQLVATTAAYSLPLTVPGGAVVAMGGLTLVTVRSTHRRRGVLRRLIELHLADVRDRGEPVSGLYASEATIYGRFGYGIAAEGDELAWAGGDDLFSARSAPHTCHALTDDEALTTLPPLYAAAATARAGMYARTQAWWQWRRIADRPFARRGRSPRRHVVIRRTGVDRGYVVYRQHMAYDDGRPAGTVDVEELIALDADAEAALLRYVSTIDLFPRVTLANAPVDCIAPWLATDYRRVARRRRTDTLWLRIDDVAGALSARRYAADGALSFEVYDGATSRAAQSRWRLVVDGGVAGCGPNEAAAEVSIERGALGSIYLGGASAATLARAGRLAGSADAIARLDRMFAWAQAPWCAEQF